MAARESGFQLRTYALIDRMHAQYAALMGTVMAGDVPVAGMAELLVEVAPGNAIFRVADIALKAADVRPGLQIVERVFGVLEIHGHGRDAVQAAGLAILQEIALTEADRVRPRVISSQVITNVDPYMAQLINQQRRGSLLIPGQTLLVSEISPAGYATLAANEAEKAADVSLLGVNFVGSAGRVMLAGTTSQIEGARAAIEQSLGAMSGREEGRASA